MKRENVLWGAAELLGVPAESTTAAMKLTVLGRREAVVEHHRGLLEYSAETVEVTGGAMRVRILGRGLTVRSMDAERLCITGEIGAIEYA